ncbi:MAG: VWA domain-containing protein [Cytophagia bacterium]|nr:VWA domain-containing protein [Cytophagia bacterium]
MRSLPALLTKITLQTDFSPWFLPLCLVVGIGYGLILYSKSAPWSKNLNWLLLALRAAMVTLLCFLLLGPLLNQINFFEEKPIVVLAIDDSASIQDGYDSIQFEQVKSTMAQLESELNNEDYELRIRGINQYYNNLSEVTFSSQSTDLHKVLQGIRQDFEQQNLVSTLLISDGIDNYGSSPQFLTLNYPVFSLAVGDTIPAQDLSITKINYNKIVYEGNQFPLVVDIFNNGYVGEQVFVDVLKNGIVLQSQSVNLNGDQQLNSFEFILDAEVIGIDSYQVSIRPMAGESSVNNNSRTAFIEVVDSKQKILIAASAPHPDIKALKSVIESKEGVEVSSYLDGITEEIPEGPFDLVILHQLPQLTDLPRSLNATIENTNTWFITGVDDLNTINRINPVLVYNSFGQSDGVGLNVNPNFELFQIDEELKYRAINYPPAVAPYGSFEIKNNADVYLYQKIGNVETNRPLLTIYNGDERKSAVFSGSGFWKWRLQENGQFDDAKLFDEIFGKLIQYLATKDDKRNFRVNTTNESYFDSESVELITEVYNEFYEKVYDYNIDLTITNSQGETEEYNYVNSPTENFKINGLDPGIYNFRASTSLAGKREIAEGSFSVEKLALEDINLTANHQLLKNISNNSGGSFNLLENYESAISNIEALNPRPITRSNERLSPIIENPLWLIILVILLSTEWFLRKYHGSY